MHQYMFSQESGMGKQTIRSIALTATLLVAALLVALLVIALIGVARAIVFFASCLSDVSYENISANDEETKADGVNSP